jgi:hypothetical protein
MHTEKLPFKICLEGEAEGMSEINVTLSFTVAPAAAPPLTVTVVSPAPAMTVGVALTVTAVANIQGGVPPYTAVADPNSQPFPPGISFTFNPSNVGEIDASGTPTAAGTFSGIILDVTDSASSTKKVRL